MNAKKGDWVRIHNILLEPKDRATKIKRVIFPS